MTHQLTLESSIAAGMAGMAISMEAAERKCPEFRQLAETAILAHLAACEDQQCDGETLVHIAKAHGAVPPDDRAFGGVFLSLSSKKRNLILCIRSDLPRKRGHGTSGCRLWGLVQ